MGPGDPATEQPESAYVGMDSLGRCKCTKIHEYWEIHYEMRFRKTLTEKHRLFSDEVKIFYLSSRSNLRQAGLQTHT